MSFPAGSEVSNLPAMQETWVQSPGHEDPREEEVATHSCILAWKIPWTEEPGGLQSRGSQRIGDDLVTKEQNHTAKLLLNQILHSWSSRSFPCVSS